MKTQCRKNGHSFNVYTMTCDCGKPAEAARGANRRKIKRAMRKARDQERKQ